jgi:hypothetical protein
VSGIVDFDLHGVVGVRLEEAGPGDVAAVARQLGPIRTSLEREPDIRVRFVDRLPSSGPLGLIDLDDVAFDADSFFVLRGRHKTRTRVRIPFDRIGSPCEIVCERGVANVPLLVPIVNTTALAKGVLPLHAAAFEIDGVGVLATGWSKGGKTETLLAFMANGARYVGDEWVYLAEGGRRMFGIAEPIRVWDWHLTHLPRYRARLGRGARLRLGTLRALHAVARRLAGSPTAGRSAPVRMLARGLPILRQQLHVDPAPQRLFGAASLAREARPDVVVFVSRHDPPEIVVEPIDAADVTRRMIFSLEEERRHFVSYYRKFRFAFPDRANALIEGAAELQRKLLEEALAGRPAFAVRHPYPVAIPALFEAIRPRLPQP